MSDLTHPQIAVPIPNAYWVYPHHHAIDHDRGTGRGVYVHCWGGIGRTGTVIGCYFVRRGYGGDAAIAQIARLRAGTLDWRYPSPATEQQRMLVRTWPGASRGKESLNS